MTAFFFFLAGAVWLAGMVAILIAIGRLKDAMADCRKAVEAVMLSAENMRDLARLQSAIVQSAVNGVGQAPAQSSKTPAQIIPIRKVEEPPHADA